MNLDVDWAGLTKRLLPVARATVAQYTPPDRKHADKLAEAYVIRAVERFLAAGTECDADAIFTTVANIIVELAEDDERKLDEIIRDAKWEEITRRVLAYTAHKHGAGPTRAGKEPADRFQEAVVALIERRRHFPHYRGVSLVAFLCATIDSIVSHDAEKMKNHGVDIPEGTERMPEASAQPRDFVGGLEEDRFVGSLPAELQQYLRLRLSEPHWTVRQYADALNVTIARVHDWNRKIKRRRRKFA